jgi:hypothetical protein
VHPEDSVLGPMTRGPQHGITARTCDEMLKQAFYKK